MSKTVFSDGQYLTPTWCNSAYVTGGGHQHDGTDADGHSSKIMLTGARDIQGVLPLTNMPAIDLSTPITTGYLDYNRVLPGPRNFLDGFQMTWALIAPWSITVGPGECSAANALTSRIRLTLPVSMIKNILDLPGMSFDPWAPGSGLGGVASSVPPADGLWLYAFVLGNSADLSLYEVGFDNVTNAANLSAMSGYDEYRRVGAIRIHYNTSTAKYEVTPCLQNGNDFYYLSGPFLSMDSTTSGAPTQQWDALLDVPYNSGGGSINPTAMLRACMEGGAGTANYANVTMYGASDWPTSKNFDLYASTGIKSSQDKRLTTASGNRVTVMAVVNSGTSYIRLNTYGYVDSRGRDGLL